MPGSAGLIPEQLASRVIAIVCFSFSLRLQASYPTMSISSP